MRRRRRARRRKPEEEEKEEPENEELPMTQRCNAKRTGTTGGRSNPRIKHEVVDVRLSRTRTRPI